jgi:hypothetical protein
MAVDIRISPTAFDYAGAWLKGVQAGQNQARLDLDWARWIDSVQNRDELQAKAEANAAAAQARLTGETSAAADTGGVDGRGTQLQGTQAERANYITHRLMSQHGYSREAASALVGNWVQESSLGTAARNKGDGKDGSDSIGIAQWNSDRAQRLAAFAKNRNTPWTDLNTQVDFAAWELNNTHRPVGDQLRRPGIGVVAASDIVHRRYEVAELASAGKRRANSLGVFQSYNPELPSAQQLTARAADGAVVPYFQQPGQPPQQQTKAAPTKVADSADRANPALNPPAPPAGIDVFSPTQALPGSGSRAPAPGGLVPPPAFNAPAAPNAFEAPGLTPPPGTSTTGGGGGGSATLPQALPQMTDLGSGVGDNAQLFTNLLQWAFGAPPQPVEEDRLTGIA